MQKIKNLPLLLIILFTALVVQAQTPAPVSASVQMYKGRPMIMLNGKPEYPAIYALTDVPGGRWSWEELPSYNMRSFCARGFKLVQVDLFLDHVWKEDGTILMDTARRQLRGVLDVCPDAAIMIRFHVNPPKWWQHRHPEEKTLYADTIPKPDYTWGPQRIIEDDEETPDRFSLASLKWKEEASEKTKEFLRQLQQVPEGNALAGIQVVSGVYGEWHYWGFIDNEPDMSLPMLQYFRSWLKQKYPSNASLQRAWNDPSVTLTNVTLPSLSERRTTRAGVFRDPPRERKIIDYYEAQHTCVADDLLHFCKLVKENWPRPIITGAFYGYFYSVFGREAAGGHLELQKVLNSPYIDFLSGPNTYYPSAVETGEPYRSRSLINSVSLHGKLWLDEMDQQPPLLPLKDTAFHVGLAKSIANVRRNVLFTFSKGMGLWFYDFGPSGMNGGKRLADHGSWGWWDEPSLMQDISQVKKLMESKMNEPYQSDADVLLVHDTRSFYYTGSAKPDNYMGHWANNWIPPAIFKSGVVHDVIHLDDLDKVNLSQYKAVVLVNTWVLNETQKKMIQTKVSTGNRHVIFLYAPGYCNGQKLDKNFVSYVTGITMQQITTRTTTTLVVNKEVANNRSYHVQGKAVNPLFAVTDKDAVSLGTLKDSSATLFARKNFPHHTAWFIALPPSDPAIWRYLMQQAGAHIYDDSEDIHYSGGGILSIHTAAGGKRQVTLKNGKKIELPLSPNTTILIEPLTGEILMH